MIYKGYVGKVEFDEDAKILHGEVIGLRDVITFQADSVAKIEKAFRDSVDDYLAFCRTQNDSPEKPASGKFLVRLNVNLHRRLAMLAEAHGTSLNALVEQYLSAEANRHSLEAKRTIGHQPSKVAGRGGRSPRRKRETTQA